MQEQRDVDGHERAEEMKRCEQQFDLEFNSLKAKLSTSMKENRQLNSELEDVQRRFDQLSTSKNEELATIRKHLTKEKEARFQSDRRFNTLKNQ